MKCKNCGAPLDEGALFCRRCGTAAPETPEPKQKELTISLPDLTDVKDRISGFFRGIGAWFSGLFQRIGNRLKGLKDTPFFQNKRLLMLTGAGAALLAVLIIVIACAASCKKSAAYKTPEDVTAAVVKALETGDGEKLYEMTKLSEQVLGAHTETFGAGDTPEAVMQGYYKRLAGDFSAQLAERYGRNAALEAQTESEIITDASIFEANRALGLEAAQYAEITGTLSVNGETATNIHIVAVDLDGEWKPLVVYLY